MKPSLLVLSAHLPMPDGTQAGMKCSYHLLRVLSRRFQIHILCFANDVEKPQYRPDSFSIFESHELFPISNSGRLAGVLTAPQLPIAVGARHSNRFKHRLSALLSSRRFDAAILDHTAMWQYSDQLHGIPVVCGFAHDVLTQLWVRKEMAAHGMKRWLLGAEASRMRNWEAAAASSVSMVMTLSEKDASLLSALSQKDNAVVTTPWFSRMPSKPASINTEHSATNVVFWGALNRVENQDAVQFVLEEILPLVKAQFPTVQFVIAGAASEKFGSRWKSLGVTITGFVDDVAGLLQTMDIALLPLRLGAGIKIKVLECMSAGLAVITTPVGIEGIAAVDGVEYLLGNTPEELAQHVIRMLNEPEACREIGAKGREFVAREFDFEASAERFGDELISRIESARKTDPLRPNRRHFG